MVKIQPTAEQLQEAYIRLQSIRKVGLEFGYTGEGIRSLMQRCGLKTQTASCNRYTCDDDFFAGDNEQSFYIAGFIAADGCVKARKNKTESSVVSISLSERDEQHLFAIKNALKVEHPLSRKTVVNRREGNNWNDSLEVELSFTSRKMCKDLERFNVVPRKTHIYTFPEWLIERPLVNHFMRGYNDGDGSFYSVKKQVYFSLRGTPEFLRTYRTILERECGLRKREKDIRINCGIGVLEYGGNGVVKCIANFLYNNSSIYLDRKKQIVKG